MMRMTLKSLTLENFKQFRQAVTFDFNDRGNVIKGENEAGKTSICSAWYWLFCDVDYELTNNPSIRPKDAEDADIAKVTAELDVDGKPLTVCKYQKFKRSKPDDNGITKTSLANSFEVNSIELSARDFKQKLENDYGIDLEHFLELSHPDVFVSQMGDKKSRDKMRNTLFQMVDDISDLDVAKSDEKMADVAELLESYKLEEVEAMQKASLRKINENYGRNNEIIDGEIRGLSMAKSEVDMEQLEKDKAEIESKLRETEESELQTQLHSVKATIKLNSVKATIIDYEFAKSAEVNTKRRELSEQIADKQNELLGIKSNLQVTEQKMNEAIEKKNWLHGLINNLGAELKNIKEESFDDSKWVFDENSTICSLCGQKLPEDKIKELKADFADRKAEAEAEFENDKQNRIRQTNDDGKAKTVEYKCLEKDIADMEKKVAELSEKICTIDKEAEDLQKQLEAIPKEPNLKDDAEYKSLLQKQLDIENEIATAKSKEVNNPELNERKANLQSQLEVIIAEIGKAQANSEADKKIEELKKKKLEVTQERADIEKILYQIHILSMEKNKALEQGVNSHFNIVRWKLFDCKKNGEVFDTCVPLIDGYEYNQQSNKGRRFLGRTDIIDGLQKYYNQFYPVFLDDFESLSKKTSKRIKMDCQAIFLKVTEDEELIFT